MIWLSFLNDIVIQTYVEMDDELPDAILNYFEQSSLVYDHEMKERRNLREKDLVHSIPGDKVKDVKIWRQQNQNSPIFRDLSYRHYDISVWNWVQFVIL